MTKVKLISCLSMFALSLSMLVMGVLALATQTITLTGEVGFNIADKSVYVKDARISDETITGFMPGYINDGLILSDATISGSSFEISLDVINTTTNNFDIVIESSQSGVSVTTEAYIPANSTDLTEITSSTPITETIVLTVTNSTSSPVDLTNILIKIEERSAISINAIASQTEYGNVSGSGEYDIGDIVTLTATESESGRFVEWRADSTTGNVVPSEETYEFELTASSPTTYYAIFEENYTIYEDFVFNNLTSTTGELVSYTGTDTSVEIPRSYSTTVIDGETVFIEGDTYTVVGIADASSNTTGAFYPARNTITSVQIPNTVEEIGDQAFHSCANLATVTFKGDSQLTSIGEYAFRNCDSLTRITIPASVTSIGALVFDGCESLTSVTFENRNGWTAGTESISASAIASTTTAATYLTSEYKFETWTRS